MPDFLQRLRERKLVQWSLAYVAAAFALIQVADVVAQRFAWPEVAVRSLIIVLAVGFFVTVALAWYHGERGAQRVTATELVVVAVLLALGAGMLWQFGPSSRSSENATRAADAVGVAAANPAAGVRAKNHQSIAVLPFANLSAEAANAYFVEGIQDEILTRLAKIGALKVISRTSTARYASHPENVQDIARQLGVAHVLEGSVQKVGDAVRVTVQLIRADTDDHVWAETYDRKLDDVFAVESDIAQAIASSMNVKLSAGEEASVAAIPTTNAQAYDAYLRGRAEEAQLTQGNAEPVLRAAEHYADATRLDPSFALAWARWSMMECWKHSGMLDRSPDVLTRAQVAVDTALRLQPELGEAYLAMGYYRYRCLSDLEGGLAAFEQARLKLPNDADIYEAISFVERRQGKWQRARVDQEKAVSLDPTSLSRLDDLGQLYSWVRDYAAARSAYDRASAIQPGTSLWSLRKAQTYLDAGDLDAASRTIQGLPLTFVSNTQIELMFKQRHFAEAMAALKEISAHPDAYNVDWPTQALFQLAIVQKFAGDDADARVTFQRVLDLLDVEFKQNADDAPFSGFRAIAYGVLGRRQLAFDNAKRLIDYWHNDGLMRPKAELIEVWVHLLFAETEPAMLALPHLLSVPNGETVGNVRYDALWDPLRQDPRFIALLKQIETATAAAESAPH